MWRVWGGGKGSCYTPKNWHVLWRGFNIESQSSSNHWLSKAMIDRLLGTIIAPSQKHFWRWYFLFPKISQGEMLVWRIPSEPPQVEPLPPWPPQLPPCAVFWSHVTNYWAQSALEKRQRSSDLFVAKSPGENWKIQQKLRYHSGKVWKSKFWSEKSVNLMGFVYKNDLHIVIRPGSGNQVPDSKYHPPRVSCKPSFQVVDLFNIQIFSFLFKISRERKGLQTILLISSDSTQLLLNGGKNSSEWFCRQQQQKLEIHYEID